MSARCAKFACGKNSHLLWGLRRGAKNIETLKSSLRRDRRKACGRQMRRPQTCRFALPAFFRIGRLLAFAIACAAYAFPLVAQESDVPNIAYVYPAGAKAGERVAVLRIALRARVRSPVCEACRNFDRRALSAASRGMRRTQRRRFARDARFTEACWNFDR